MTRTYAECETYVDEGVVHGHSEKSFATAFKRPDQFRFIYRDRLPSSPTWKRSLIWRNKEATREFSSDGGASRVEKLSMAIAGYTGVSGGSAHTIPRMLLPSEITGWCVATLENVVLDKEVLDDLGLVFRVRGFHPRSGHAFTLHIHPETRLLHRLARDPKGERGHRSVTTYQPLINVDVERLFSVEPESLLIDADFPSEAS